MEHNKLKTYVAVQPRDIRSRVSSSFDILQALKDTGTVVALIALLATVLFALNTALTEGSNQLYSLRDPNHPLFPRK